MVLLGEIASVVMDCLRLDAGLKKMRNTAIDDALGCTDSVREEFSSSKRPKGMT
jgi:hypothetical protein